MKIAKFSLKRQKKFRVDFTLSFSVLLLVGFGILMVYSASYYQASITYGTEFFFMRKQIIGAVIGLVAMALMYFVDYKKLRSIRWVMLGLSIVLLGLVFVPHIGVKVYGARRWVNLGVTTMQPSEIAKFAFVIFAAASLSSANRKVKEFRGILPTILAGGVICLLIIMEPNMSITMCVGITMIVMLFVGGLSLKHFLIMLIPIVLLVPTLIIIEPYRLRRLIAFLDPFASASSEGFQLVQSLYAVSSGGMFGVGLLKSRQKYLFLPFAESDFIFSIIAEEFGLFGCICLLLVFMVVIIRGIKIALNSTDRFGCYLASGITSIIATQVLINVAVVTGSIPPTGLPLPFISAGSTSLVVFMAAVGILLNIDKQSHMARLAINKVGEEKLIKLNLFHKKAHS